MFKCEQCKKSLGQFQMFGLILRNGKTLQVCPDCYKVIHNAEVKELELSKQATAQSGLLEQGFTAIDIKEFLKRWSKKQVEEL